jgi:hypothetical protein
MIDAQSQFCASAERRCARFHRGYPRRRSPDFARQRSSSPDSEEHTGTILPVTGADLDEMFAIDSLAARR